MEVILKQDVPGLGYKSDLITVKNGYARNYLIPKGLAVLATESSKKVLAEDKKQKSHKEEKILKEAEELAKGLEALKIKIAAKAGTSGKIFGSVNDIQIANAIKEQHKFDIDRKDISVDG
ncbi:MAG: 50S ribosomal protein L9, partial [Bacteroidales bacterium]|nr:50S ribosomal protein L9 [Bacteroidales bacterium]